MKSHISSDPSRKKVWKEETREMEIFGKKYIVSYPKLTDPRIVQISVLTLVNILGQTVFNFFVNPLQLLLLIITCVLLDIYFTYNTKKILVFPTSGLITSLSLGLLMETGRGVQGSMKYTLYILAGMLAIGSKYFLTYKGKHIFNPSNFAVVILLALYGYSVNINPNEWPTSFWLLIPIIIIGTRLIIKAKVVSAALSFFAAELVLYAFSYLGGSSWSHGVSSDGLVLLSPSLYIFTFYMITDPRTAPRNWEAKILYGISIGALHWTFASLGLGSISLFLGLFVTCIFVPVLEKVAAEVVGIYTYIH